MFPAIHFAVCVKLLKFRLNMITEAYSRSAINSTISSWTIPSSEDFPIPKSRRFRRVKRRISCHLGPSLVKIPAMQVQVDSAVQFCRSPLKLPLLLSDRSTKYGKSGRPENTSNFRASRIKSRDDKKTTLVDAWLASYLIKSWLGFIRLIYMSTYSFRCQDR